MAIVSGIIGGASAAKAAGVDFGDIKSLFGGGGLSAGNKSRNEIRGALRSAGFTWRKTSGVPSGEEWNIDNWGTLALQNMVKAYENYGNYAVELHNSRQLSDSIASNYFQLESMIKNELPESDSSFQRDRSIKSVDSSGGIPQSLIWGAVALFGFIALKGLK